jgi:hypothetical protein
MDDKRRGNLSLLLSLSSLASTAFFFILLIMALRKAKIPFSEIQSMPMEQMWSPAGSLFLMGWFPGFALAIVSLIFLRRSQGPTRLSVVWVFSGLVIIASLVWFFSASWWQNGVLPG